MTALASLVPQQWEGALREAMQSPSFAQLAAFLDGEAARQVNVCPPRQQIFAALEHTPPHEVRVVILGQDPYPTAGNANGLCFSVSPGVKVPASLKNIFTALNADLGVAIPKNGDLSRWALNGVLLLNTVLTVREGEANSHQERGWEPFTTAVLEQVGALNGPVVFMCFGKQAQALAAQHVDGEKHVVLSEPHPSPLNGRKFVESVKVSKIFSKTNAILLAAGREPIDWSLE